MKKRDFEPFPGFTKIEVEAYIRMKLKEDQDWLKRACVRIYEKQTIEEREKGRSIHYNGVGFNRHDGPLMSSIAKSIKRGRQLSKQEFEKMQEIIPRYSSQIIKMADRENLERRLAKYYGREKVKVEQGTLGF